MDITNYQTSAEKEESGVWLKFDGAEFLVLSSKSPAYQRKQLRAMRKLNPKEATRKPEMVKAAVTDLLFDECLKGWKGVNKTEENGTKTALPFNAENIATLKKFPDFVDWLTDAAADVSNFTERDAADLAALKSAPRVEPEVGIVEGVS